jgi:ABC-type branched-subunit amino acid transport system substrate-binding protein
LASKQIDAVRFHYTFEKITPSQQTSFAYQAVTFSKTSNPTAQALPEVKSLFTAKVPVFDVKSRDYQDYIRENNIKFIVYDKNQLDTKMAQSKLLELVYSNDRYVIFKIRGSQ